MPLLDMIGVDATQRSFCIAFAFLSGETEADYMWALKWLKSLYTTLPSVILTDRCLAVINAASTLFPPPTTATLICIWHANKAVLARCQPAFADNAEEWKEFYGFWHDIIRSPTEEEYNDRLAKFQQKYVPGHRNEVGYIKETWLIPFKRRLVYAWVDQSAHFGNTATSRVEGMHALLKSYLKRSTLDLFDAWKSIRLALLNQLAELHAGQAKQQLRIPQELSKSLYGAVQGWVSHEAQRKVEGQRRLLAERDEFSPACTGTFSRVWGLPCVHVLATRQGEPLLLHDFHSHWRLQREGIPVLLLEPRRRIDPRQAQSASVSSTQREASEFEVVEARLAVEARAALPPRAPSKCSRCHAVGHTMTSRLCPERYADIL